VEPRAIYSARRREVNQLLNPLEGWQIGILPTSASEFAATSFDCDRFVMK
jgi:hypothetical protein